jgi:hypothetical protein
MARGSFEWKRKAIGGIMKRALILFAALTLSCAKSDTVHSAPAENPPGEVTKPGNDVIDSATLAGQVNGGSFRVGQAIAHTYSLNSGKRVTFIFTNAGDALECGLTTPKSYVSAGSPLAAGSYEVSLKIDPDTGAPRVSEAFISFETQTDSSTMAYLAKSGTVRIDSITEDEIKGGLSGQSVAPNNAVNGTFTAKVCH